MNNSTNFEIYPDGTASLGERRINVPNVKLQEIIGRGANGIVVRSRHSFLDRDLAVKFWLKLKLHDRRDKFQQGIDEARKMAQVDDQEKAVHIYDAGEIGSGPDGSNSIFYAVMDYFPGITLEAWLTQHRPELYPRYRLAEAINFSMWNAARKGVFHGDLHTKNILVEKPAEIGLYTGRPDFRIVDFGTSRFAVPGQSFTRHLRLLRETLDRLIAPLNINRLWGHRLEIRPGLSDKGQSFTIHLWYGSLLEEVEAMLRSVGAFSGGKAQEPYADQRVQAELEAMVRHGELKLDLENLGQFIQSRD